ncbi:hypothetical protein swp_1590 [Shewanella piezotolerans WP3]|uniref:Uncharacterized protein n=1 Tax=Shewanella piezotolerans (strain WP3 / JCM 13877) TaxID=225849 RepID=B8CL46_SHEPW|nr:hypothetical protein swp_1590 [Shewanella piezotolerans WP3]
MLRTGDSKVATTAVLFNTAEHIAVTPNKRNHVER